MKCALVGVWPDFLIKESYDQITEKETTEYFDFESERKIIPWWQKKKSK